MAVSQYIIAVVGIAVASHMVLAAMDYSQYGLIATQPGKSCRDIYEMNPTSRGKSGYYLVMADHVAHVYCDMVIGCGREKDWMMLILLLEVVHMTGAS